MRSKGVFIFACAVLPVWTAVAAAAESGTETFGADPSEKDVIYNDADTGGQADPMPSVNMRQEFGFSSHQNIDSFLGTYENPYASPEYSYQGSKSEPRNERAESDWRAVPSASNGN